VNLQKKFTRLHKILLQNQYILSVNSEEFTQTSHASRCEFGVGIHKICLECKRPKFSQTSQKRL